MPISAVLVQPAADAIKAAYRPVTLRVSATDNVSGPTPPVVYCDIYFNGIYYKTISKTQYTAMGSGFTEWEFDIQDAAQEYLGKYIEAIGETLITEAEACIVEAYCQFRCSGLDAAGFIVPDTPIPVQATSSSDAEGGGGTASNTFYIVNSALQHQDNQELTSHLNAFKTGTWAADVYPLTHRRTGYAMIPSDNDSFPVLYAGAGSLRSVRLNYRLCNQATVNQISSNIGVTPVCNVVISTPTAAQNGSGWLISWNVVSGSPAKFFISTPEVSGDAPGETVNNYYQLPALSVGSHIVTVRPICSIDGEFVPGTPKTVTITVAACVPVAVTGSPTLPNANENVAYNYSFPLTGSTPIGVNFIDKPAWMTVVMDGNNVVFGGTPDSGDVGTDIAVSLEFYNCAGSALDNFDDTIDVIAAPVPNMFLTANGNPSSGGMVLLNVTPAFYNLTNGSFPMIPTATREGVHSGFSGVISLDVSGGTNNYMKLLKNGVQVQCIGPISGAGLKPFASETFLAGDDMEIILTLTPC